MTKPNFIFKTTSVFVLCLLSLTLSFAQADARAAQVEPSYEVVLQVVVGSNDAAQKNNLPANLAVVTKNLRNNFSFSIYNRFGRRGFILNRLKIIRDFRRVLISG